MASLNQTPQSISHTATSRRVLAALSDTLSSAPRVADVGCGRGHFSGLLLAEFERLEIANPVDRIVPIDLMPEYFEVERLTCRPLGPGGDLPLDDNSVDAAISIEVIEHVEDQFAFLRELTRITRPGGLVIVTTPNVHSVASRLRALTVGFPQLYDPLPLARANPRFLGGHIHPIHPYFLFYGAQRAGLEFVDLVIDRRKVSAAIGAALLYPFAVAMRLRHRARWRRRAPDILAENAKCLARLDSWDLATGRTAILVARVPK